MKSPNNRANAVTHLSVSAEFQTDERMKELQAFFKLSEINDREGVSLSELYGEFVGILPGSWRYSDVACARMQIGGNEFRTRNFAESAWVQSAPIKVNGAIAGKIEVGYL